jgi:nucleoside-diphosphate-sugar epimerase
VRVLLIGGSGFIGRKVTERLQQRGHHVIIFHRGQTGSLDDTPAERIIGNRLEIDQHRDQIKEYRPEAAIDFLPWSDTDTIRVIKALKGLVERVVHLSSGDVYRAWGNFLKGGFSEPVPLTEESPLREELYPYAGSRPGASDYDKILAERAILSAHLNEGYPGAILRLPMVYGPGDPQNRTWPYVKRMLDGRPNILLEDTQGAWLWQRGYVDNVAFGIALAAERQTAAGQIYNVGSPQTFSLAAWVQAIGAEMDWEGQVRLLERRNLPEHLHTSYNYQQHILYDTEKIRRELGYYEIVPTDVALRSTIDWQRDNLPAQMDESSFDYEAEDAALKGLPV